MTTQFDRTFGQHISADEYAKQVAEAGDELNYAVERDIRDLYDGTDEMPDDLDAVVEAIVDEVKEAALDVFTELSLATRGTTRDYSWSLDGVDPGDIDDPRDFVEGHARLMLEVDTIPADYGVDFDDALDAYMESIDAEAFITYIEKEKIEKDLEQVMTASEIEGEFSVSRQAVIQAISNGWIAARQSGATWLIRRVDAVKRWGGKARSIALLLTSLGISSLLWSMMA
jgi:hypothetical protein